MTKKRRTRRKRRRPRPETARPRVRTLDAAVALAGAHAFWALIQWKELLAARSGAPAFCVLGGGDACEVVVNSPFAAAIERWTVLPVAGWGVVWSLAAIALPLWTRIQRGRGRPSAAYWSATLATAAAGAAAVVVLAAASLASGALCTNCAITYLLAVAYGAVCLRDLEPPVVKQVARGLPIAAAATLAAFLLLLYPGIQTSRAIRGQSPASIRPLELPPQSTLGDRDLRSLLQQLPAAELQALSDALAAYARGAAVPPRPPRSLIGPAFAPVRITEFSDILCSHCADLHETLATIRRTLPPESFALEARQFPLDAACNPHVTAMMGKPVRCTAAKALICAEEEPYFFDFASALFERQRTLTEKNVYALAEPYIAREKLAACMAAPATQAKLSDDIAWAMQTGLQGTPHVLVNGRTGSAFAPFLRAIVLAGGDADQPSFSQLPAAQPPPSRRN
ncbi:MAG: DsbA family protein [Myxococcales bacterium]|nr:DsbA family protein [Myxococcales bacterium]